MEVLGCETTGAEEPAMKINDRVEGLVRDALDAAVKRDSAALDAALRAFPNDDAVREGVALALAICAFIMIDIYEGKPNDDQIRAIAEKAAQMETWAEPTADEVHALLSRLLNGAPLADAMPTENIIILAFVVTASLLASLHLKEEQWWNYLDRAEAAIESR
jgi:hypothetical protein